MHSGFNFSWYVELYLSALYGVDISARDLLTKESGEGKSNSSTVVLKQCVSFHKSSAFPTLNLSEGETIALCNGGTNAGTIP